MPLPSHATAGDAAAPDAACGAMRRRQHERHARARRLTAAAVRGVVARADSGGAARTGRALCCIAAARPRPRRADDTSAAGVSAVARRAHVAVALIRARSANQKACWACNTSLGGTTCGVRVCGTGWAEAIEIWAVPGCADCGTCNTHASRSLARSHQSALGIAAPMGTSGAMQGWGCVLHSCKRSRAWQRVHGLAQSLA
jgi:hypothetical protein